MSDKNTTRTNIVNSFEKGMWKDSLPSLQPAGTWVDAWSAVRQSDLESYYGLSNESSNELHVELPGIVRSILFIEERNYHIAFLKNGTQSEIGIIYKEKGYYKKFADFPLDNCEFNDITYKIFKECGELHIYFSANNTYYTLNIDDPCCKFEVEELLSCDSGTIVDADVVAGGSLRNGSYKFTYQLVDDGGNATNWFTFSKPIFIGEDDNIPGEVANKAIQLSFKVSSQKYPIARIAVGKNVGTMSYEIIGETGISEGNNSFLYNGSEETTPINLSQILARKDYYLKGRNLIQFENRLILYNIQAKFNLNYQTTANNIRVKYVNYVVPIEDAHLFQGLRPNEKYWFGIRFNYCDNTTSAVFDIPGLEASGGSIQDDCKDCEVPVWKKSDTSVREELFLTDVDNATGLDRDYITRKVETNIDVDTPGNILYDDGSIGTRGSDDTSEEEKLIIDCGLIDCGDTPVSHTCTDCIDTDSIKEAEDNIFIQIEATKEKYGTTIDNYKLIQTSYTCSSAEKGEKYIISGSCFECDGNYWNYINNGLYYNNEFTVNKSEENFSIDISEYAPEKTYSEDGCDVIDINPKKYSKGSFGYYETTEKYPETEDSDCNPIYGDLAGKNVRLHVVPSRAKEPNFVSFSTGVPTREDPANEESNNTFVFMIGIDVENIVIPTDLPKPLDEDNPYTIMMVERTIGNTSVIGSGLLVSTMKGDIDGVTYAIPKNGLNGPEFFDGHINPTGDSTFRGGYTNDKPAYVVHSPDFELYEPSLTMDYCIFEQEVHGKGYRHGLYAEGKDPESLFLSRENNFGARQSLNLNNRIPLNGDYECIKASSYAPADKIVGKGSEFSNNLLNLKRESSVYIELDRDGFVPFTRDSYVEYGGGNGAVGVDLTKDGATDDSFIGDTVDHECPILNARAHDVTFIKDIPNQYGSPINQVYVPLLHGKSSGLVGDSFVNSYNYKRTSLISDKTPKDVAKPYLNPYDIDLGWLDDFKKGATIAPLEFEAFGKTWTFPEIIVFPFSAIINALSFIIKSVIGYFFTVIGYEKCGFVPDSGDRCDKINVYGGLRGNKSFDPLNIFTGCVGDNYDGYCFGNIGGPLPAPASRNNPKIPDDAYYPHFVKTTNFTIQNSNVNHYYRQTGEVVLGEDGIAEVFNKRLKTLELDTSFKEGGDWANSYLERTYVSRIEPPKALILARVALNTLITLVIPLAIIVYSIIKLVGIWATLYLDAVTAGTNIYGIILASLVYILLIGLGTALLAALTISDADNKLVDNLLGITSCKPDKKFSDNTFGIKLKRVRQIEDNYHRYSLVYSDKLYEEKGYGVGAVYNTDKCETPISKIVYSNPQINDSPIDYWRSFNVNDYQELPTEYGRVTNMFKLGNKLFVHTSDMILDLLTGKRSLELDKGSILLGNGNLFSRAVPLFGGVSEGYAGLIDSNAAITTSLGYMFPDRKARKLLIFDGSTIKKVSDVGMKGFFQENFNLRLLEDFPGYKHVDTKYKNSVGYSIGIDNEHNRILFTKRDYTPINKDLLECKDGLITLKGGGKVSLEDPTYFYDNSFTVSFDLESEQWISNHYYTPHVYAWDRFNMFSFNDKGMWKHNVKGSFDNFYGCYKPFSIDVVINDTKARKAFKFISSKLDTEAYKWKGVDYNKNIKETFNKMVAYNSHQNSGILDVDIIDNSESILDRSVQHPNKINAFFTFNGYNISQVPDKAINPYEFMFNKNTEIGPSIVNNSNISDDIKNNKLTDNHLVLRLIFSKFEDVKLFTKFLTTKVELQHD